MFGCEDFLTQFLFSLYFYKIAVVDSTVITSIPRVHFSTLNNSSQQFHKNHINNINNNISVNYDLKITKLVSVSAPSPIKWIPLPPRLLEG